VATLKKATVESLRRIQWDKSNKWEFSLDGLNEKFKGWVPATSMELGFFGVTTESLGSSGVEYISGRTYPTFTISYIDSEDLKVTKFFTDWMKECVSPDGYEVLMISQAARHFTIHKLNSRNKTQFVWEGKVIPTGNITYTGDSDGSIPQYQVNFIVVAGSLKWRGQ